MVRTNWLLAMRIFLCSQKIRCEPGPSGLPSAAVTRREGAGERPPSSAGPALQEEGQIRVPAKVAESADAAHVGAPVRPVPDRSNSKTTRNMRITVGINVADGNLIPEC
ncbi:hypothetical protein GCM10009804_20960 [Kribbella hippodromi]|uniref:Uncharacterized protein n=1 Tax=Kribbella hippodromi TaxID=434347 RepID=A0ABP4NM13_9ACTN